jgi:BTB/POZ domain-containing protein KCTD9
LVGYLVFYSYGEDFPKNILVEAHGMLLDILVIGIFILWLNRKGENKLENKRYQEEIDDFRRWNSHEAGYRIVGNVRRLNRNGITNIHLDRCHLVRVNLSSADLKDADLRLANLQRADLSYANLSGADLFRANLSNANLEGTNLSDADLERALNCTNEQLAQAESLVGATLPDGTVIKTEEAWEEFKKEYPPWWERRQSSQTGREGEGSASSSQ